jgi:hypothetical protein
MTGFVFLLWSVLTISCNAIVNVTVTSPVSLSHGHSIPQLHAHTNPPSVVKDSRVNQRVSELRALRQSSPSGLPVTTISIADSFASEPAFYSHPMYVDSCSAFNVANEIMFQQIQFPVGDECCVTWDNSK